jgi:hypothetical protein
LTFVNITGDIKSSPTTQHGGAVGTGGIASTHSWPRH